MYGAEEALNAGDDVSLSCNAFKGDTPLSISWTFHGKQLAMDRQLSTQPVGPRSSYLLIRDVSHGHSGTYTCRARNAAGEAAVATALVVRGQCARPPETSAPNLCQVLLKVSSSTPCFNSLFHWLTPHISHHSLVFSATRAGRIRRRGRSERRRRRLPDL